MAVSVKLVGADKVSRMLLNLGPQLNKQIDKTSGQFMKDVQKSAKLRAPSMSGALKESIKVRKGKKNWILSVDSPYGIFQEEGFKGHLINSNVSTRNSLGTFAQAYGIPPGITVQINSFGGHHFVRNALEKNIAKLPITLSNATKKAIAKS